jgi:hypothetical protein
MTTLMLHEHGRRDVTSVLAGVPDVPRALEDREKGVGGHVQEGERQRGVGTAVPSRGHVIILGDNIGYVCAGRCVCVCWGGGGWLFACGRARAEDRTYRRPPFLFPTPLGKNLEDPLALPLHHVACV